MKNDELLHQWRQISRFLTFITALAFPLVFFYFWKTHPWGIAHAAIVAALSLVVIRAVLDGVMRVALPRPSLFGVDDPKARSEDITSRRRFWFWKFWAKVGVVYTVLAGIVSVKHHHAFTHELVVLLPNLLSHVGNPSFLLQGIQVIFLFFANFAIFMGPLLLMGISQIKTYEPGDASWGVKLEDVRGQKEAKEEVRRVVEIWQSGTDFEKLGGKRERGMLFLGPPGVGKTFLAKAIATGFNAPFITIPGSGFAQTFIGIDAVIVRILARKAKKASRKWGGQCIVFIDEIDAVGMRRNSLQGGQVMGPGGMFGGFQMALNQLLVVMDSIDSPPAMRMWFTKKLNTLADAVYFIPPSVGAIKLRLPTPKPRKDQIFFVGATNVPLDRLDPALVRAGRMGRHIFFRTPTKEDRKDVFDLYITKASHDPDLDREERRDEMARVTQGVSPATIEQIISLALMNAQHDGRDAFDFKDFVEALTTLEAGSAVGIDYTPKETRAVALHEAGHAAAAHIYKTEVESSRLSIRMRGQSLGHHQSFDKEERFGRWRSEEFATLIHLTAAYATEYVFYGENGVGVTGDLMMASNTCRIMTAQTGMQPFWDQADYTDNDATAEFIERLRRVGARMLVPSEMKLPKASEDDAALFLGHAFITAYNFILLNKERVGYVASVLEKEKEIFGDDLIRLLDEQDFDHFEYLDLNQKWEWPS